MADDTLTKDQTMILHQMMDTHGEEKITPVIDRDLEVLRLHVKHQIEAILNLPEFDTASPDYLDHCLSKLLGHMWGTVSQRMIDQVKMRHGSERAVAFIGQILMHVFVEEHGSQGQLTIDFRPDRGAPVDPLVISSPEILH
jgi:hypothetical protein